jgi:uncharacterized protein (TIGR02646 family)
MIYFAKSQPAPDCLEREKQKANGDYKCGCVLEQLKTDFKNKCYICESKEPTSINVEHFTAHRGDKDLMFDWLNLFWSCGHCNNTKLDKFEPILNCMDLDDVSVLEQQLRFVFKPFPHEPVQIETTSNDGKVLNNRDLLLAVFNGTTKLKNIEADNLRNQLLKEIKHYQDQLIEYYEALDDDAKNYHLLKIKSHLNSASAFTAFKRQIVKDNPTLFIEFSAYLDG